LLEASFSIGTYIIASGNKAAAEFSVFFLYYSTFKGYSYAITCLIGYWIEVFSVLRLETGYFDRISAILSGFY